MPPQLSEHLVEQARMLAKFDPQKPKQVNLRRAVSGAYYGVFHAVSDELSRTFRSAVRPSAARLLQHATAKNAAAKIGSGNPLHVIGPHAACPAALKLTASDFVLLQEHRHLADYSVASTFTRRQVLELIDRADRSVKALRASRASCPDELQAFLLALLGAKSP